ncbi:DUF998 domain-containing protein [Pseudonocardia pini]|uniref:DUF998 domain-containing protein n=1 Tax=Pseudonocardia pini TaxID=2758030 RepID=UPI0015F0A009|nr:DUF998 domain-containing protein [Pseudonocardia pini]
MTLSLVPARTVPATRVAVGGLALFALASVVAGLFSPGYDPLREGISALAAVGMPAAPVMVAGFLALAAGTTAAGVALWQRLPRGIAGRTGAVLVMLCGALMVVVGLARQDCSDFVGACVAAEEAGTISGHHVLHQLVSLAVFTVLAVAPFLLAAGLRRNPARMPLGRWSALAGVVALVAVAALPTVGYGDLAGVVQRLVVLLLFGWPVLVAAVPVRD